MTAACLGLLRLFLFFKKKKVKKTEQKPSPLILSLLFSRMALPRGGPTTKQPYQDIALYLDKAAARVTLWTLVQ